MGGVATERSTKLSSINVELKPEQFAKLQSIAERLGVSIESLASSSLQDLLSGPDEKFEQAAESVLKKNEELYRRLA
jgi:hypothetical protein